MINCAIWRNTYCNLNKYISEFGQTHFAIWTNTFQLSGLAPNAWQPLNVGHVAESSIENVNSMKETIQLFKYVSFSTLS